MDLLCLVRVERSSEVCLLGSHHGGLMLFREDKLKEIGPVLNNIRQIIFYGFYVKVLVTKTTALYSIFAVMFMIYSTTLFMGHRVL